MTGLDWPTPQPKALDWVSPTKVNTLLACPRRAAYELDDRFDGLSKPNLRTALGTASHSLIEQVLRGDAPPAGERGAWLVDQWDKALAVQVKALQEAWPDRPLPSTEAWPGLVATRRRLMRRLDKLEAGRRPARSGSKASSVQGPPPLPWIERWLRDPGHRIAGKADLVEERDGRVRVVDHKMGVHQGDMGEGQRRQLLLYAHLVSLELGIPVDEVAVANARGVEVTRAVGEADVAEALADAGKARSDFVAARAAAAFEARPAPDTCRYCPFRVVCGDYWSAREGAGEDASWPQQDIKGTIDGHPLPNVVRLDVDGSRVNVVLAEGVSVDGATELAAVDLEPNGPSSWRMRWNSTLRTGTQLVTAGA